MKFAFTEEQDALASAARDLFARHCSPEALRASWQDGTGRVPGLYQALAEQGMLAVVVPEAQGGLGLGPLEMCRLQEEAGFSGCPEPFLEAALAGTFLPSEGLASGDLLVSVASDEHPLFLHADSAHAFLYAAPDRLIHFQRADCEMQRQESVDQARHLYAVSASHHDELDHDPQRLIDHGRLYAAAQLLGLSRRLLTLSQDYVSQRHQFGRPIGRFQAVSHPLVDVAKELLFAESLLYRAAWLLSEDHSEARRAVTMAKAELSEAARLACRTSLQVHGAMGYSFEVDLQLYLKRAWALAATWGDPHRLRQELADTLFEEPHHA